MRVLFIEDPNQDDFLAIVIVAPENFWCPCSLLSG